MEYGAAKPIQSKPIIIILIAGLIAFFLYLFVYLDPQEVAQTLAETDLALYAAAFFMYTLNTVFSSLAWHRLLDRVNVKVARSKAFLYTWTGLFFEATVPQLGWSAEISKTYMLSKDAKIDAGKIGSSVIWQKIFNITLTVITLSTGLGLVLLNSALPLSAALLITVVLLLSITALCIVYYVSLKPSATKTLVKWAVRIVRFFRRNWNPTGFVAKSESALGNFHSGVAQLRAKPKALVLPLLYSASSFACEVSVVFLAFAALGQPIRIDAIFIVFTLTGVLQTVGVAFFGFPEVVMAFTLQALSISPEVAIAVTLLTRIVTLWFRLCVSYGALQWSGLKIIRQNREQRNQTRQTT